MDNNFIPNSTESSMTSNPTMMEQMSNYEPTNNILLIEDNPGDARFVEILLSESDIANCKVTNKICLADGMAALEEDVEYAAVLLDLTLPDSSGFETLEKLLSRFPDENVIVMTGLSDKKGLGVNSVKAGAQDFLIKGEYDSEELSKTLRYSIERSGILKRLEETQRIANIGNWEFNPSMDELFVSTQIFKVFGLELRKTVFKLSELMNEGHPFKVFQDLHEKTLAQAERTIREDIRINREDGTYRDVFIQCSAGVNTENKMVLTGIMQDITERKEAEQELLNSQQRYQDIFNTSKDPIYISTLEGHCEDFNPAMIDLFGYTREELPNIDIHSLFSEEQKTSLIDKLKRHNSVQDFEVEIERKDKTIRYCLLTASVIEKDGSESYNGVLRDITEKKQAEELRKARDMARTSAKMKEQFIASISHEMRTPMNAILGMANIVIDSDLNKEQYNYISTIKQSSELLLGIVNDILEISTLENGKILFEINDFDLHELLDNLVQVMKYKVEEKKLDLKVIMGNNVPRFIRGDKLRLNQVLYNLVGNAVKFTDEGSIEIRINNPYGAGGQDDDVFLQFEVQDSGIGIPQDKLHAIFETFTRIRTKDRIYEGTGLGLSIAKNLVEQQGGKIRAESTVGEGSTFFFDLIFERGTQEEAETPTPELTDTITIGRPVRLLLVEDNKLNQMVAKKTLQKKWPDIELTIADNGKLGIEAFQAGEFDIILMDIMMPIMDGYEATQFIRNNLPPEKGSLPILAMTAHANISKDEQYKEYGMDDFVLKPFKPEQLFGKIAQYVNQAKKG